MIRSKVAKLSPRYNPTCSNACSSSQTSSSCNLGNFPSEVNNKKSAGRAFWLSSPFLILRACRPCCHITRRGCLYTVIAAFALSWLLLTQSVLPLAEDKFLKDEKTVIRYNIVVDKPEGGDAPPEGRSCEFRHKRWHCRECDAKGSCRRLYARGRCPPFNREAAPTSASQLDPKSTQNYLTLTMHRGFGIGESVKYRSHPSCTMETCFRLPNDGQCGGGANSAIKVFTSDPSNELFQLALQSHQIELVNATEAACVQLVTPDSLQDFPVVLNPAHNYLLWNLTRFRFPGKKRLSSDMGLGLFHVGHAMIASDGLRTSTYRPAYDFPIPMERHWGRRGPPSLEATTNSNRYLVTYRGSLQDSPHRYYQHRWLAAEYWGTNGEDDSDVLVDVQCKHVRWNGHKSTFQPYQYPGTMYDDMMHNSTFGFCPGGSAPGTYHFSEVLSTNTIPVVVVPDFVLPFSPELDWKSCAVEVPESRIADIPRLLRLMPQEEIASRQWHCHRLFLATIGDRRVGDRFFADPRVTFETAMRILRIRIHSLQQRNEKIQTLLQDSRNRTNRGR